MTALPPVWSASPQGADLPGGAAVGPLSLRVLGRLSKREVAAGTVGRRRTSLNMNGHSLSVETRVAEPRRSAADGPLKEIAEKVTGPVSVWRKQMVLGPGYEFALLSDSSLTLDLPDGWEAHYVERTLLHSGMADL